MNTRAAAVVFGVLLTLFAHVCKADNAVWPTKTVTLVVATQAGGGADRLARTLADYLAKKWGQSVVVENRPGATTIVGSNFVAKSPPDGYTLLFTLVGLVQSPALRKSIPYDVEKDFAPITQLVNSEILFLAQADAPYRSLQGFIAAARSASSPLNYGTGGIGHTYHIYGAQLAKAAGIELNPIPYRGEHDAITGLLGGQIQAVFGSIGTATPLIQDKKLQALGVVSKRRWKGLPDVPTFAEQGVPIKELSTWFGMLAPAGTPVAIVNKVAEDVREALHQPRMARLVESQGMDVIANSPADFAERIHIDLKLWKQLVQELGISPQ